MRTTKLDRILRKPEVLEMAGFSSATLYRGIKSGDFPKPIRVSKNCVGWLESVLRRWLESRPEA